MKERFNILWIDDEHEKELGGLGDEFDLHGFDITAFTTSREGIEYLENNLSDVDAVILDAKVYDHSPDEVPSEKGLSKSIRRIMHIRGENKSSAVPFLIYTGQPDLMEDKEFANRWDGITIIKKTDPTEILFDKLHELIGNSPDAIVRNQFRPTYEACTGDQIDPKCWMLLSPVLRSITHLENFPLDPYNDIRKALEWVFRFLHRHCIIHEKLIDNTGRVNLQLISIFLAGKPAQLNSTKEFLSSKNPILPKLLVDSVKFILDVTQPGSHTEQLKDSEFSKPSIEQVKEFNPNHHLIQVVALMTADLAEWAANYVAANQDAETNRSNWEETPSIVVKNDQGLKCIGKVCQRDSYGNLYVDTSNLPETNGKNVRIQKKFIESGTPVDIGDIVSTLSTDRPDKNYRDATHYRIVS